MSLAYGALAVALLAAAGWWPMRRFAACVAGDGWAGRIGASLALGAVVTGIAQLVLALLGFAAGWWTPCVLAAVSCGLAVRRVGLRAGAHANDAHDAVRAQYDERIAHADAPRSRAIAVVLLVVALASAGAGVGLPFKADGSKFWGPRARDLSATGVAQAPSMVDAERMGFHRDYPVLVPLLMAPVFASSPQDAAAGPKLVLQGLAWALLLLSAALLLREGVPGRMLLLALGTLPAWTSLDVRESLVAGGFADVTIALFLLLLIDAADRLRRGTAPASLLVVAILAAGGLVSTKLEGAVHVALVCGAWFLAGPLRARAPWLLTGAALLAVPTLVLRGMALSGPSIADLTLLVDGNVLVARAVPLAAGFVELAGDASVFGLFPLLLAGLAWRGRRRLDAFTWLFVLGMAAFLIVVYLSTTMHLGRHLLTSAHRLAFQCAPALALLVARAAHEAERP